jgi:hypothetical protein
MFLVLFADIPTREVKGSENAFCSQCGRETMHQYEVVSFHTSMMFVKVFCHKRRYVKICTQCQNGQDMTEDEFNARLRRMGFYPEKSPRAPEGEEKKYEKSKTMGIKYCSQCGEKVYPDVGYCTACAVRGSPPPPGPAPGRKKPRR